MTVYVFGLGHIGLPMAVWIALHEHQVYGIDINPTLINDIRKGTVNIEEYYNGTHISQLALNLIEGNLLRISTDFVRVNKKPSVFVFAVGITSNEDGSSDISPIISVLSKITPSLVPGDLLLLRTTLIPGTIDKFVVPRLNALDFPVLLAYCPETIMETRAFGELENNPIILAGINEASFQAAALFLNSLAQAPIYKASTIRTAEMVKVIQNIHRDVNIAFINEISEAACQLNIDIDELRTLANTHPRVKLLQPGPGVGGYCLPNALSYLQEAINQEKCRLTLMETARKLNSKRPARIVEIVKSALDQEGKTLKNSIIALAGLAMKDFCSDCRLSPALEIASLLIAEGAKVQAYDSLVPLSYPFQTASFGECLQDADCLVIAANQKDLVFDLEQVQTAMNNPIIVDTRNVFPDFPGIKVYKT